MGRPHLDYRANDARSVFVTGPITQELIDRVTPQIRHLRGHKNEPITVYLDSVGGPTRLGGVLASLLRCPDQDGQAPRIITVVTNVAHSAAADLLASGDYAIAYPEALVHYHGTRHYYQEGITVETAQSITDSLQAANEYFAIRLAERSIERMMFLFLCELGNFPKVRQEIVELAEASDVEVFGAVLRRKLSSELRWLPMNALKDFNEATALTRDIFKRLKTEGRELGKIEADVLRYILDYELRRNRGRNWTLTKGGLAKVVSDFVMFNDFSFGVQRQFLRTFVRKRWRFFVGEEERQEIEAKFRSQPDGEMQVYAQMEQRVEPLWHFVYSLCKRLQQSENTLTATDAYWLGIVDEVLGTQLPSVRIVIENAPPAEAAGPGTETEAK